MSCLMPDIGPTELQRRPFNLLSIGPTDRSGDTLLATIKIEERYSPIFALSPCYLHAQSWHLTAYLTNWYMPIRSSCKTSRPLPF